MNKVTNYCFDKNDNEIMDRKKNLCKSGSDCEYYYCDDGICKPSYSSCKFIIPSSPSRKINFIKKNIFYI